MSNKVDILVFAAHPDDAEMSCAGVILSSLAQGKKAVIVDLTKGELGTRGTEFTRAEESAAASIVLGIEARENLDLGDGFFENNKENQIKIIECIRKYRPEIILCNAVEDRHPDHGKASKLVSDSHFLSGLPKINTNQEAWRAKHIYHYIQDRNLKPDFVVDISEFMEKKMEAIRCYKTQFFSETSEDPLTYLTNPDFLKILEGRCAEWGKQIGVRYGEGFTVEKFIGLKNISDLI
jgi:bacillithiol biosynthesis deacetylase BshB1